MEIQRYDMIAVTRCGEGWQELQREPEGEWMLHEDHLAALAAQQEEIDRLKDGRKPKCPDCNSVGMSHCSDPENCGGLYWPDSLYRALEAENAKLQARLDAMSAPVSDEELKEARATIEQLKSYQANYEHATEIERAEKDADTQKLESLLSNSNAERRELRVKIDTLRAMLAARAKTEATG